MKLASCRNTTSRPRPISIDRQRHRPRLASEPAAAGRQAPPSTPARPRSVRATGPSSVGSSCICSGAADRDAEDHPAGIGGFDRAAIALRASQRLEAAGIPSHSSSPCQHSRLPTKSAGMRTITKYGMSSRHGCSSLQRGSRLLRCNSFAADPVVALVDRAEAQPHRIGEIDAGDAARIGGAVVDARRPRRRRPATGRVAAPAAGGVRRSQRLRARIARSNSAAISRIGFRRQDALQRAARRFVDDEDVVALVDARRGPQRRAGNGQHDDSQRRKPRACRPSRIAPEKIATAANSSTRVADEIVDRQPERRDHHHQHGDAGRPQPVVTSLRQMAGKSEHARKSRATVSPAAGLVDR